MGQTLRAIKCWFAYQWHSAQRMLAYNRFILSNKVLNMERERLRVFALLNRVFEPVCHFLLTKINSWHQINNKSSLLDKDFMYIKLKQWIIFIRRKFIYLLWPLGIWNFLKMNQFFLNDKYRPPNTSSENCLLKNWSNEYCLCKIFIHFDFSKSVQESYLL